MVFSPGSTSKSCREFRKVTGVWAQVYTNWVNVLSFPGDYSVKSLGQMESQWDRCHLCDQLSGSAQVWGIFQDAGYSVLKLGQSQENQDELVPLLLQMDCIGQSLGPPLAEMKIPWRVLKNNDAWAPQSEILN
jgi:hypothetical protein